MISLFVMTLGYVNKRLVPSLPKALTRYADPQEICHGKIVGDCVRGDERAARTILLIGDSHAAQLNYFSDVVGRATETRFKVITGSSCVPIDGFDAVRIKEWARKSCDDQIRNAKEEMRTVDAVVVAGMWSFHASSEPFLKAFDAFLLNMQNQNMPVLILSQIPKLNANIQRVYRFNSLGLSRSVVKEDIDSLNSKIHDIASRYENVTFVDFSKHEMFDTAPEKNGTMIYLDHHHLNEEGARLYGEAATPYFDAWIDRTVGDLK